jgi:hypothetical protein
MQHLDQRVHHTQAFVFCVARMGVKSIFYLFPTLNSLFRVVTDQATPGHPRPPQAKMKKSIHKPEVPRPPLKIAGLPRPPQEAFRILLS